MTEQQKENLNNAIYDFAIRVLNGGGTEAEVAMLPNLFAVTHVLSD